MVPTPPPPWRFRHRPPRRREPVSLSCRIRERRPPPGARCCRCRAGTTPHAGQGSASPSRRGSLESRGRTAAGVPESRGSERAAELQETGWHLQCGAQTAETGAGWGWEEGGSERTGTQRRRRRLGTQSRQQPEQARGSEPWSPVARSVDRNQKQGRSVLTSPKPGRPGGWELQIAKCPLGLSSLGKARPVHYSMKQTSGQRSWQMVTSTFNLNCVHVFPGRLERQRTMLNNNNDNNIAPLF